MTRKLFLCAIMTIGISWWCIAQDIREYDKAIIDADAVRKSEEWPDIPNIGLSPDGKYAFYWISHLPAGSNTLAFWSVDKKWKKEITGPSTAVITRDGRWAIFKNRDSLGLLRLGSEEMIWLPHVSQYQLNENDDTSRLIYMINTGLGQDLVLRELKDGSEKRWTGCMDFVLGPDRQKLLWQSVVHRNDQVFYSLQWMGLSGEDVHMIQADAPVAATDITWDKPGKAVLFNTLKKGDNDSSYSLHRYDLIKVQDQTIWEHKVKTDHFSFDKTGDQLLFLLKDTLWYWHRGLAMAELLATNHMPGLEGTFRSPFFSPDGKRVLFYMSPAKPDNPIVGGIKLNVWHYQDKVLPPAQTRTAHPYAVALNIDSRKIVRVEQAGERVVKFDQANRYALVEKKAAFEEWSWQGLKEMGFYLVSLENGGRRRLPIDNRYFDLVIQVSSHENYIIYYDPVKDGYCSYEIASGKTRNLTKGLGMTWQVEPFVRFFNGPNPFFGRAPRPRGLLGWIDGDSTLLVYDSYDIWKLDPSGCQQPVNMTRGYGRQHQLVFELNLNSNNWTIPSSQAEWILNAFNPWTKQRGIYRKKAGNSIIEPLLMGPYGGVMMSKSGNSHAWILNCTNPSEKRAIYFTQDFKSLTPLCILQPQKGYRWYSSELVSWKMTDGNICQGTLYKPENLDTTRKYPLLFNYYQVSSDGVYTFNVPKLAAEPNINVPYFVSRGYLVFMPDIHYRMGHPGENALQAVVSAVHYLARRPYVDTRHMGLAGHSWGATETNYIITHSQLFAAAAEGAGVSDIISRYNSLSGDGVSSQPTYEVGQSRMGVTLWQRPDLYIENSPVLRADKVTTPLLILHNREDEAVPWAQGVELFTALRRLGKRAWMLEYDGEGHSLTKPENILDYTTRLTQFFDHYLKGAPAPVWMTQGVPQSRKGIDSGLELDTTGREP